MIKDNIINQGISKIISAIESVLYYPVFQSAGYDKCIEQNLGNCGSQGIPFLVLWIMCASLFLTVLLKFVNLRLFTHGFKVALGKYSSKDDKGEVTPFQSMVTAIAATVGIGNIAGVVVAVSLGGPGAILWMVIMGFLGMSVTFSEVTLAQKYREIDSKGTVLGGPFRYLRYGLADLKMVKTGKFLAMAFALCCLIGSIGVAMFQTNQAVSIVTNNIDYLEHYHTIIAFIITFIAALVLIGGIKRIAIAAECMVPFMALLYISGCLTILFFNYQNIPSAISLIFKEAFDTSAAAGGMIGAIIAGVKRAMFSNEAGLGTTPIAHSAAKSAYPARQGAAGCLNPFFDTVIICFMSGLVIVVTGAYQVQGVEGVQVTAIAFETVAPWFSIILTMSIFLFAYSTVLTYGYYAASAWQYIFNKKTVVIYYIIYFIFLVLSGSMVKFDTIVRITDTLTLSMCLPNLLGIYLLHRILKKETSYYVTRLQNGEFEKKPI